jgi:hypothetical protein
MNQRNLSGNQEIMPNDMHVILFWSLSKPQLVLVKPLMKPIGFTTIMLANARNEIFESRYTY